MELKSPESGIDYDKISNEMSDHQKKRKEVRVESLHNYIEDKSGVKVHTGSIAPGNSVDGIDNSKLIFDDVKDHGASANDDLYSIASIQSSTVKTLASSNATSTTRGGKKETKSKIADCVKHISQNGARTISMNKSCQKYDFYNALDESIKRVGAVEVRL